MKRAVANTLIATAVLTVLMASAPIVSAQSGIGARVDAVRDGMVRLSFAARAGVCGNGDSWYRTRPGGSGSSYNNWNGSRDVEFQCDPGPVRLVVVKAYGEIQEMRTYVGGRWKADTGYTELGTVSAKEVGQWLLDLAERGNDKPARESIHVLTVTDSVEAWPVFLRIARNEQRPKEVRSQAVFWLGEFASDKVTASLDSIAYEPGDREVRKQAIFALSRRPTEEAVPNLLRMAETLPDRELRKTAIFWLSRSNDPRALAWITKALNEK